VGVGAIGITRTASAARRRRILLENLQAWLFVLPALVVLGLFHFLPAFAAFGMSLMRWGVLPERFAGIDNYVAILDPHGSRFEEFANSLVVTLWYVLLTVPVEMVLGLLVAYLLFEKIAARGAYRTVYFLPYITSTVAAAAIFAWIFNPQNGFLNYVLGLVGIGPQRWTLEPRGIFELIGSAFGVALSGALAGPSLALVSVAILTVWRYVGFHAVIFMAGLANIGKEYYEAARVDGASERQIFFHVTLPLLSPTTFFVLVVASIGTMRSFNEVYVLTTATGQGAPGGPLGTTTTLTLEIFKTFFQRTSNNGIGLGAAMSFILLALVVALTFVQFRVLGRRVQYQ
jgi:multiple sugar transport system permease protein